MAVPNPQGTALWVWEILPNGTYKFYAEGPGAVPAHSGIFSASGGRYTLKSTTMEWSDSGTHQLANPSAMQASGKLGTALWQRAQTGAAQAPSRGGAATPTQIVPSNFDWPVSGVPAMAQRALRYVRGKWQPDAFLTTIDIEQTAGLSNAQSPAGGVSIKFLFYSPGKQNLLTLMPNSPIGDLMPGSSADPSEEHALPASFVDLPDAVAKLQAHGIRGKRIVNAHLENYGPGSAFYGAAWMLDTNLEERALVLAELPARDEVKMVSGNASDEESQGENVIHVNVTGLRNDKGEVRCDLFASADGFPFHKAIQRGSGIISGGRSGCDFHEDTGSYAILVYHNEGSSIHLNPGPGGVPREGYGVSNNPSTGALPKFSDAVFPYRGGRLDMTIAVRYP